MSEFSWYPAQNAVATYVATTPKLDPNTINSSFIAHFMPFKQLDVLVFFFKTLIVLCISASSKNYFDVINDSCRSYLKTLVLFYTMLSQSTKSGKMLHSQALAYHGTLTNKSFERWPSCRMAMDMYGVRYWFCVLCDRHAKSKYLLRYCHHHLTYFYNLSNSSCLFLRFNCRMVLIFFTQTLWISHVREIYRSPRADI